jgi:hypothetical protein
MDSSLHTHVAKLGVAPKESVLDDRHDCSS